MYLQKTQESVNKSEMQVTWGQGNSYKDTETFEKNDGW